MWIGREICRPIAGRRSRSCSLEQPSPAAALLVAYIGLDRKDQAFRWLEKAYAQHSNAMTGLKVDPVSDPLRGDPRFQQLLHRVALAP